MKTKLLFLFILAFHGKMIAQKFDLIILVNEELIQHSFSSPKITIEGVDKTFSASYYPGNLEIDKAVYDMLESGAINTFTLSLTYTTYEKDTPHTAVFDFKLSKRMFAASFLVAHVYDLRDKKYRRWYRGISDANYLVDYDCYGCPKYIPYR